MLIAARLLPLCVGANCASFATVRSAEVAPGASIVTQASLAGRPGDDAAWFFTLDCAANCDRPIASGDVVFAYGVNAGSDMPFTIGAGLNGTFPYVEGYAQLGRGTIPFGIGARAGIPIGWAMHELYGRVDIPLSQSARVLWNPGVVYLVGNSPNGENPGSLTALTQGVGVQLGWAASPSRRRPRWCGGARNTPATASKLVLRRTCSGRQRSALGFAARRYRQDVCRGLARIAATRVVRRTIL